MKRLLVIGAGFLQSFLIQKAKELGYYTIAIDKNPSAVGFNYSDESATIDIINKESCLDFAKSKNIDGVITAATDYGVISAAYIAKKLGLPGIDYEVAKVIKNKYLVRRNLFQNRVDDLSQFFEVDSSDKLNEIKEQVNYPVIVKPSDGSGSKAINKADNFSELISGYNKASNESLSGKVLVEDYILGEEYGVESFVYRGEVSVLGIMAKKMTSPPNYAELGHHVPSGLLIEDRIKNTVIKAIKSLGVNFGAVNMDVLVTPENKVYIIDVGARMGGNLIGSHIIPLSTNIDYMKILIEAAIGDSVKIENPTIKKNVISRLLALSPGKVKQLPDFKKIEKVYQVEILHFLTVGSEIREYKNNLDGWGYVISVSDDFKKGMENAEKAVKLIDKGITRK